MKHTKFSRSIRNPATGAIVGFSFMRECKYAVYTRRKLRGFVQPLEGYIETRHTTHLEASVKWDWSQIWVWEDPTGYSDRKNYTSKREATIAMLTNHKANQNRKAA